MYIYIYMVEIREWETDLLVQHSSWKGVCEREILFLLFRLAFVY
jgi:hypothetical protein